jgi:hypothetical protein
MAPLADVQLLPMAQITACPHMAAAAARAGSSPGILAAVAAAALLAQGEMDQAPLAAGRRLALARAVLARAARVA